MPRLALSLALTVLLLPAGCRADDSVPLTAYELSGAKATPVADGVKVDFGAKEAYPNIMWKGPTETGWDWSKYSAFVITLKNPAEDPIGFHMRFDDRDAAGKSHSTQVSAVLPGTQTVRYYMSLQPRSVRVKSGMRVLPPLAGDYGTRLGGDLEPSHIGRFQIFRANPKKPASLIVKSFELKGQGTDVNLDGIVDRYGQYTRADWPDKIKTDADFISQKNAEAADLKAPPALIKRSRWGGWGDGPKRKATGFFRTEQIDGKWWLVDPDGYLFLSTGIDVVRPDMSTNIAGREAMFADLPADGDPYAKYFSPAGQRGTYNFLAANQERKFGANFRDSFGDRAIARLRSWGFNTIGNWTPEKLGQEHHFPYVVAMGTKRTFATVPGHKNGKMPDPWDPAFAADVEANVAPKAALAKDDPACLGYFFDNELPWGMPDVDTEHYVLCHGALSLGPESPAKRAFVDLMKARYDSIEKLDAAWGTTFASWDEFTAPFTANKSIKSDAERRDFNDYLTAYAEKYFETVATTIKKHDPNHLYLGCRFAFWFTKEAVRAAAKYADVISFNIYTWNPDTFHFPQTLGKPCIVGEFHFGAPDRGLFSGDITTKDQNERAARYSDYVKSVLSEPGFIGVHWFQYYDEPVTGRGQDGENFNIGFASITDTPYPELIAAARSSNAQIYGWHSQTK